MKIWFLIPIGALRIITHRSPIESCVQLCLSVCLFADWLKIYYFSPIWAIWRYALQIQNICSRSYSSRVTNTSRWLSENASFQAHSFDLNVSWMKMPVSNIHLTLMWGVQTRRDHQNPGRQPEAPQEWLWRARWSVGTIKFQTSHITFRIFWYKPSIILDSPQHLAWGEGRQMRSRECR